MNASYSPGLDQDGAAGSQGVTEGRRAAQLFGALFILLGITAMIWLVIAVVRDPGIRAAVAGTPGQDGRPPSLIIAFLTQFGIVMPALVVGLGALAIRLGFWLRTQDVIAARWAQVVLGWLLVGSLVVVAFTGIGVLADTFAQDAGQAGLAQILPPLVAMLASILFAAALYWLNRNGQRVFYGREQLGSRETRLAWTLLIPTLAVFILVAARPVEQTFIRSLTDKRFAGTEVPHFVGLQNYQDLLGGRLDVVPCRPDEASGQCATSRDGSIRWASIGRDLLQEGYRTVWNVPLPFTSPPQSVAISGLDPDFLQSVGTTLLFTIISVSLELTIALFMALSVNSDYAGRGLMRAVMLIPWAIPTVVSARLWELMLKDTSAGIVNRILMDLHVIAEPQAWLSDLSLQLVTVILVDVWKTTPFMALLLLAGLQSISKDLYEAAEVDGATRVRQLWYITLPLLRPTIAVALVFRTLDSLRVFDLFNVLFGRQQLSMATYNYETLVNNQMDGYASAISIILFLLISVFAVIYVRLLNVETD
jgi:trehalose/maltose transport system permease protein